MKDHLPVSPAPPPVYKNFDSGRGSLLPKQRTWSGGGIRLVGCHVGVPSSRFGTCPLPSCLEMVLGLASGFCELHSSGKMDFAQILVPASCHHSSSLTCHYSPSGRLESPQTCPAHSHLQASALAVPRRCLHGSLPHSFRSLLKYHLLSVVSSHTC